MNRKEKWADMAKNSRAEIEDFKDFSEDKAIVWADVQIENYKKAMLALIQGNRNWHHCMTEEKEEFINTMVRRAEAQ